MMYGTGNAPLIIVVVREDYLVGREKKLTTFMLIEMIMMKEK